MLKTKIRFLPENKESQFNEQSTILDAALNLNIDLTGTCGGKGKCGKCKIKLLDGNTIVTKTDRQFLSDNELEMKYRLACQAKIAQDLVVEIPIETRFINQKILTCSEGWNDKTTEITNLHIDKTAPNIQKIYLELPKPTLEDNISDLERLLRALTSSKHGVNIQDLEVSISLLKKISTVLREGDWKITLTLTKKPQKFEIIEIEAGDTTNLCYGIAFDIGTSTIVGYLMDLTKGEELSVASAINPQSYYGEDVVTRIEYTLNYEDGRDILQFAVIHTMDQIIEKLVEEADINYNNIYEIVVVGNTVMQHLLFKLDLNGLAVAPYIPVTNTAFYNKVEKLGLKIDPLIYIYSLPTVAGYLGSDAVALTLISGIAKSDDVKLAIDLGTNGEIILGSQHRIVGCSTAAGPAFEGGHITYGTRAIEGAIDSAKIIENIPELAFTAINNKKPLGITGSGLVDIVAELLRIGVIDASGKFEPTPKIFPERLNKTKEGFEFIVVEADNSLTGRSIILTQKDLRELQLAKAAINAGIEILMQELEITSQDLTEVLIAGAFGNYINKSSALAIKLIPDIPLAKIRSIGNAAGAGAKLVLLSTTERKRAESIAEKIEYIELSEHSKFQDLFVRSMGF